MPIENLPKGCQIDPPDERDFKIEAMGALPPVDWNVPFSVPEPHNEDQGQSDACVSYGCSYYHENLESGKVFSRRDLFARIAIPQLGAGAYIRDGILAIVNQGQALRSEVSDPSSPTPTNMRDKTGITAQAEADDRELNGFVINSKDIDTIASAIKLYGGVVFGLVGNNAQWQDLQNPNPPSPNTVNWQHCLYAKGYHRHADGQKCIIAKSSWCSEVLEHHIRENYFKAGMTFNPWTLIPKGQQMQNQAVVVKSKKSDTVYVCYPMPLMDYLKTKSQVEGFVVPNPIPDSDSL